MIIELDREDRAKFTGMLPYILNYLENHQQDLEPLFSGDALTFMSVIRFLKSSGEVTAMDISRVTGVQYLPTIQYLNVLISVGRVSGFRNMRFTWI